MARQTGLKLRIIRKALVPTRASASRLEYRIKARGGDIALKYFSARETGKGVSANPFGKRKVFTSTFIKGGKFPSRVTLNMHGHVFARDGSDGMPIEKQKSGVILPNEMVQGASAEAWRSTVAKVLPRRVLHELRRATNPAFV